MRCSRVAFRHMSRPPALDRRDRWPPLRRPCSDCGRARARRMPRSARSARWGEGRAGVVACPASSSTSEPRLGALVAVHLAERDCEPRLTTGGAAVMLMLAGEVTCRFAGSLGFRAQGAGMLHGILDPVPSVAHSYLRP